MAAVSLPLEIILLLAAALVPIAGVVLAWRLYVRRPQAVVDFMKRPAGASIHRFWFSGWGFDALYDTLCVRPFVWVANMNRNDFVDLLYKGAAWFSAGLAEALAGTQSGMIRRYALGVALGAVIALGFILVL
jgi:NADH-quinone oxidoreductase subunit L